MNPRKTSLYMTPPPERPIRAKSLALDRKRQTTHVYINHLGRCNVSYKATELCYIILRSGSVDAKAILLGISRHAATRASEPRGPSEI